MEDSEQKVINWLFVIVAVLFLSLGALLGWACGTTYIRGQAIERGFATIIKGDDSAQIFKWVSPAEATPAKEVRHAD